MHLAKLTLHHRESRDALVELGLAQRPLAKRRLERLLFRDHARAEALRVARHGVEDALHARLLLARERELSVPRGVEHVARSGIAVQLGGARQPHPAPCREIVELLGRQAARAGALLLLVWRRRSVLRGGGYGHEGDEAHERGDLHPLKSSGTFGSSPICLAPTA